MPHTVYIHIPYANFFDYREIIEKEKVNIELYVSAIDIDNDMKGGIEQIGQLLTDNNLKCTVHGPFYDLNPGAIDPKIRQITCERFLSAIDLVRCLKPEVIVLHPCYDELRCGEIRDEWLDNSKATWNEVLSRAVKYDLRIALENTFETEPDIILNIIQEMNSSYLGYCFDIGHFNMLSEHPLERWFSMLGDYLFEVHLHDNNGETDQHFALGKGTIDFQKFFQLLKKNKNDPALVIEAHNEEDVRLSLSRINNYI